MYHVYCNISPADEACLLFVDEAYLLFVDEACLLFVDEACLLFVDEACLLFVDEECLPIAVISLPSSGNSLAKARAIKAHLDRVNTGGRSVRRVLLTAAGMCAESCSG